MQELFSEVAGQFQSAHQYDKFIKETQREYDVKIYRLGGFSLEYAGNVFAQLNEKYESEELVELPQGWYQNQRRLYVWFIVCFIHLKMLEPNKFVDQKRFQKYWRNISLHFHRKDIPFLKFQLLTIIKNKGRTSWKRQEDQLLKQAYRKFEKGQWNEVAKYFYFQSRGQFFKTPKQCRERYQNHLNDRIKKGEWSPEEEKILFEYVRKNGPHWANIIALLDHTRTEHMIKNRYKSVISKLLRQRNCSEGQALLQAIRNVTRSEIKNTDETIMRDEQGVLQVESDYIDEDEEEPPIIQHRQRKEKKRGRPKKIKEPVGAINGTQPIIVSGEMIPKSNSLSRNSWNSFGEIRMDQFQPYTGLDSFSKRNPLVFQSFPITERHQFFTSSRFNYHNPSIGYRFEDEKNNTVLFDPIPSRVIQIQDSYESMELRGSSLNRSKRSLIEKNASDSFLSGFLK